MLKFIVGTENIIGKLEVFGETKNTILFSSGKETPKINKCGRSYFPTYEDAHDFLWRRAINKVIKKKKEFKRAERELRTVKKLQVPKKWLKLDIGLFYNNQPKKKLERIFFKGEK